MELVRATEAQERERDAATWPSWGGPLPLPAYLALVQRLRNHPWPRASMTTWLLLGDTGLPLASCQAYQLDSSLKGAPGRAYGIGSVFVAPELRGRGLASLLLGHLAARTSEADPGAQAFFLHAAAGVSAYRRAGFQNRPVVSLSFPALPGDPAVPVDAPLQDEDLGAALRSLPALPGNFSIRPSEALLSWQVERERILLGLAGQAPPPLRGAQAGTGLALWSVDPLLDALVLLVFRPGSTPDGAALLECARRAAAVCGRAQVLLLDAREAPGPLGGAAQARPGVFHPMLRPLAPGLQADGWSPVQGACRI